MKNTILLIFAMIFFMAGATLADTVSEESVNVQKYSKGKTTLKLSGTLSETALKALARGTNSVSICNTLGSYLTVPTLFPEGKKGYGTKAGGQKISVKSKNGKFSWTEKDVAANFAFVVGNETVKPDKAALKSSGTIDTKDIENFKTQKATVLDMLSYEKGLGSVAAYTFTPELKGKSYKHANKGEDLQVKFSANSKGKATATFKLLPNAASPAFISESPVDPPPPPGNNTYMVVDLSGGTNAASFAISYLDDVPEGGWTEEYKTTKLVLRKIEPGTFTMGSPEDELGRYDNETQHQVTLTNAYYIGVFETTQKQYELIMGSNPSYFEGNARPVENVSYNVIRGTDKGAGWPTSYDVDDDSFFGILRAKTQVTFDLPTEAQWEFACRAGTTTALNRGKNLSDKYECDEMAEVGRYYYNKSDEKGGYDEHTTVGSYLPNAWGLYDMHGNVFEWCLDWCQSDLGSDQATEPIGTSWGAYRVFRGGCWDDNARICRSASSSSLNPDDAGSFSGFRVVLVQNVFSGPDNLIQKDFEFEIESGTENTLPIFQTKFYGKLKNGTEKLLEDMGRLEYDGASGIVAGVGKHKLTWIPDAAYTNVMDEVELRFEYEDVTEQANYLVLNTTSNKMRVSTDAPDTADDKCRTDELWLRRIEPGTFIMGSPEDELGHYDDETQHEVTLTKAYYIGVFEITQKQCQNIMGANPSYYKGDLRPAESISYNMLRGTKDGSSWPNGNGVDEGSFMGQLRKKAGNIFDLPTEAQWEFACRAGTTTALNSGKNLSGRGSCTNLAEVGRYWYNGGGNEDDDGNYIAHAKVGSYLPNAWGLYDMHGNVWEWCLDWYESYDGDATDPKGGEEGYSRVLRGGSWGSYYTDRCRSAYRNSIYPGSACDDEGYAYDSYGFRVVLVQ
ncbi:formylglycine-generating enzyme family protein [bacterium]|nr:formylglycine-generating enzyme family protein [bacterium]